jgi:hypothetical protein
MSAAIHSVADLEAMLNHQRSVSIASLACMRAIRKQIEANRPKAEILRTLATEINEIENLSRTGRRNPANTLEVAR